ncbi:hypothetical protein [Hymenobacter sp. BT559]|uniref:hypothetical protein n=1 Tax=Hymenobacter sp. BT559 TaxID=2795729 RepID=UPI0018EAB240|nr:hypothetical protein [Hymenobacter sp. BT559]MBJ6141765.1 hypothetical protein [Hymenobacter sp. BT559]
MSLAGFSPYFENAAVRLSAHPNGIALFQYQPGKRSFTDLKEVFGQLGNLLQQRGWRTILTDQRELAPFSEESAWITGFWTTYFAQHGGSIVGAVIASPNVFARLASSSLWHNNRQLPISYTIFAEEEPAVSWLLAQVE